MQFSSPPQEDSPRGIAQLAQMETELNARLDLLDRLKRVDLHTACARPRGSFRIGRLPGGAGGNDGESVPNTHAGRGAGARARPRRLAEVQRRAAFDVGRRFVRRNPRYPPKRLRPTVPRKSGFTKSPPAGWRGEAALVTAHLDAAAEQGALRAKKELRMAKKQLRALEREADTMARKRESIDGDADECEIAVARVSESTSFEFTSFESTSRRAAAAASVRASGVGACLRRRCEPRRRSPPRWSVRSPPRPRDDPARRGRDPARRGRAPATRPRRLAPPRRRDSAPPPATPRTRTGTTSALTTRATRSRRRKRARRRRRTPRASTPRTWRTRRSSARATGRCTTPRTRATRASCRCCSARAPTPRRRRTRAARLYSWRRSRAGTPSSPF